MKNWRRTPLKQIRSSLRRLWLDLAESLRPWRLENSVSDVDDVPSHIRARRAFLVATVRRNKWLVFDCPCRTGHRVILNLDESRDPFWTLRLTRTQRISLSPSIDYKGSRRSCHYFLSNGRVVWAPPSRTTGLLREGGHNG